MLREREYQVKRIRAHHSFLEMTSSLFRNLVFQFRPQLSSSSPFPLTPGSPASPLLPLTSAKGFADLWPNHPFVPIPVFGRRNSELLGNARARGSRQVRHPRGSVCRGAYPRVPTLQGHGPRSRCLPTLHLGISLTLTGPGKYCLQITPTQGKATTGLYPCLFSLKQLWGVSCSPRVRSTAEQRSFGGLANQ